MLGSLLSLLVFWTLTFLVPTFFSLLVALFSAIVTDDMTFQLIVLLGMSRGRLGLLPIG